MSEKSSYEIPITGIYLILDYEGSNYFKKGQIVFIEIPNDYKGNIITLIKRE